MAHHTSNEETLPRDELTVLQRRKLAAMFDIVLASNAFYRRKYQNLSFDPPTENLEKLPFTTREEIQKDQIENPPYGTNLTFPFSAYNRFHQTSGSTGVGLRCLDRAEDWEWWKRCWRIIYRAAGVTADDRFMFPFSFGPFVGFWAAFESAVAMGNLCLPAGGMTTQARLRMMLDNEVTVIGCTPTYALRMAEVAAQENIDLASSKVRALIVAGEPGGSIASTREQIESAWGARVFDHTGMTEVGAHGFECVEAPGGVHLIESEFIAEVIDPDTLATITDDREGELVLTNLGRLGNPLIRYRTGDRVRLSRERCRCGRSFAKMEGGILGRVDDMIIIRGNNVYPSAIEAILRRIPGIAEYRAVVATTDHLCELRIDIEPAHGAIAAQLPAEAGDAIRDGLNFRPEIRLVKPGDLPRFEMKARRWVRE